MLGRSNKERGYLKLVGPDVGSLGRSSESVLVEKNVQNKTVASLEARSTKRGSGSIGR